MKRLLLLLFGLIVVAGCTSTPTHQNSFVQVNEGQFVRNGEPYYYVGTNLWYGAILAADTLTGGRERLLRELDALQALGVENLRVLAGADGKAGVPTKVEPTLQTAPGVYDDMQLAGLDFLMAELGRRNMQAVLYLNNAWEWSGGYSQYLEWAGAGEIPIPLIKGYTTYMEYVAQFVNNDKAQELFFDHVRYMVGRTNRYTGLTYTEDPAIFSWQIGNEPRAFSPENKEAFARFIEKSANLIRSLDANHMISTGSEGMWGCENDWELVEKIHALENIDYINIHIWPYNWQWLDATQFDQTIERSIANTDDYIDGHLAFAERLQKPIVIEEFGFPRDEMALAPASATTYRDRYYRHLFGRIVASKGEKGLLAGCNFWGWGGEARPLHENWQAGDPYCGDPAQEGQGLNSVFDCDSTVEIIREFNNQLK